MQHDSIFQVRINRIMSIDFGMTYETDREISIDTTSVHPIDKRIGAITGLFSFCRATKNSSYMSCDEI